MTLIFNEPLLIGDNYVFNPDVFEVVGTPVITDEGIQDISTGNPYNNYVKSPAITFGSTFDVNVGFTVNSISSACRILGETNSLLRVFTNANGSALDVRFEASNGDVIVLADSVNLGTIVQYFVTVNVAFTGTSYIIKIYKDRNLAYTNTVNSTLFPRYTSINTQGTNTNTPQNYSIDLKQFKIIVDGEVVLSGKKKREEGKTAMTNLYSGTVATNGAYKTLTELTGLAFEVGNEYTIQVINPAFLREGTTGSGFYVFDNKPFKYIAGNDDLFLKNDIIGSINIGE